MRVWIAGGPRDDPEVEGTHNGAMRDMNHAPTIPSPTSFLGIADDLLRDVYMRGKYRDLILPSMVKGSRGLRLRYPHATDTLAPTRKRRSLSACRDAQAGKFGRSSTKRRDGVPDNPVGHGPSIDAVRATRQCHPKGSPALTASYGSMDRSANLSCL